MTSHTTPAVSLAAFEADYKAFRTAYGITGKPKLAGDPRADIYARRTWADQQLAEWVEQPVNDDPAALRDGVVSGLERLQALINGLDQIKKSVRPARDAAMVALMWTHIIATRDRLAGKITLTEFREAAKKDPDRWGPNRIAAELGIAETAVQSRRRKAGSTRPPVDNPLGVARKMQAVLSGADGLYDEAVALRRAMIRIACEPRDRGGVGMPPSDLARLLGVSTATAHVLHKEPSRRPAPAGTAPVEPCAEGRAARGSRAAARA